MLLLGLAFVFLYPFLYMIITSLKSNSDLNNLAVQWIPTELKFENYFIAADLLKVGRYARQFGHCDRVRHPWGMCSPVPSSATGLRGIISRLRSFCSPA